MSSSLVVRSGRRCLLVAVCAALVAGPGLTGTAARARTAGAPKPWIVSTIAGGVGGPGPATQVAIANPCGVSSSGGDLYLAGQGPVREVNERTGWLTTPAGDTSLGVNAPTQPPGGGLATQNGVDACDGSVDHWGNLLVAGVYNPRVEVVAARTGIYYGQSMTAGDIYGLAGNGQLGIANGVPARTAYLSSPMDVEPDAAGNVVIADSGFQHFGIPAVVQVVASKAGTYYGRAMKAGYIYIVAGYHTMRVTGNGGPATKAGLGAQIGQVRLDRWGNLVICQAL